MNGKVKIKKSATCEFNKGGLAPCHSPATHLCIVHAEALDTDREFEVSFFLSCSNHAEAGVGKDFITFLKLR